VRLDDLQIERYSRQIVLQEIGAAGQARLLDARVAIVGTSAAAECTLSYLAAAGVGTLAAPRALHAGVDPEQPDVTLEDIHTGVAREPFDALVADAGDLGPILAGETTSLLPPARRAFWIAAGRAGEMPPCAACAEAALPPLAPPAPELAGVRTVLLGTVIATEVVKALLKLGTPLRGRVVSYDPDHADITITAVTARPGCMVCAALAAEG
jgi:hypothetical protein